MRQLQRRNRHTVCSPVQPQADRALPRRSVLQLGFHYHGDDFLHALSLYCVAEFCVAVIISSTLCALADVFTSDEYYKDRRCICLTHTDAKISSSSSDSKSERTAIHCGVVAGSSLVPMPVAMHCAISPLIAELSNQVDTPLTRRAVLITPTRSWLFLP